MGTREMPTRRMNLIEGLARMASNACAAEIWWFLEAPHLKETRFLNSPGGQAMVFENAIVRSEGKQPEKITGSLVAAGVGLVDDPG